MGHLSRETLYTATLDKVAERSWWTLRDASGAARVLPRPQQGRARTALFLPTGELLTSTGRCSASPGTVRIQDPKTLEILQETKGDWMGLATSGNQAILRSTAGDLHKVSLPDLEILHTTPSELGRKQRESTLLSAPVLSRSREKALFVRSEDHLVILDLQSGEEERVEGMDFDVARVLSGHEPEDFVILGFEQEAALYRHKQGLIHRAPLPFASESPLATSAAQRGPHKTIFLPLEDASCGLWDLQSHALLWTSPPAPEHEDILQGPPHHTSIRGQRACVLHMNQRLHTMDLNTGTWTGVYEAPEPLITCTLLPNGTIAAGDRSGGTLWIAPSSS